MIDIYINDSAITVKENENRKILISNVHEVLSSNLILYNKYNLV
jgi:hypothetical protein